MKKLNWFSTMVLTCSLLLQLSALAFHTHAAPGEVDLSFDPGPGVNGHIYAIAMQPDGKAIIGGASMTWVKGVACQNILAGGASGRHHVADYNILTRLNGDGSRDSAFEAGGGLDGRVHSVVAQPDGKVLVGGVFGYVNGTTRSGLARLNVDGSLDGIFIPDPAIHGNVLDVYGSIASQPDGKVLLAGGLYNRENGEVIAGPCRFNADGSLDRSYNAPFTDGDVDSIVLQSDGSVLVCGGFVEIKGVFRQYVARLYGDLVMPALGIVRSGSQVILSWPMTGRQVQLQETTDLSRPNFWSPAGDPAVDSFGRSSVLGPIDVSRRFFRLQLQ